MEKTTHAPKSSEQKRAQRDYAEMRIAVATALESWAELENDLARLLHLLLGFPTPDLGLVIYYSPSSLETRMSIVDDVFQCRVPLLAHGDDIVVCWNGFYDAFRSAKIARNNIVHGNIRSYSLNNSKKWQVRLTAPVLDPMRQKKPTRGPLQMPGRSASDIRQTAKRFDKLREFANSVIGMIVEVKKEPFDWKASLQKLDALRGHLPVPQNPAPKPRKPLGRPTRT